MLMDYIDVMDVLKLHESRARDIAKIKVKIEYFNRTTKIANFKYISGSTRYFESAMVMKYQFGSTLVDVTVSADEFQNFSSVIKDLNSRWNKINPMRKRITGEE